MVTVVNLADQRNKIKPKSETFEYQGHKYVCTFDPNAPKEEQWVWEAHFTKVYRYVGSCPTMEAASRKARRKLHYMIKMEIDWEEHGE